MNSLSRFDAYVTAAFFGVRHPRRIPSSPSLSSISSSPNGSSSKAPLSQLHHSTPPPLNHPRLSNLPPTPRRKRSLRRRNPKPTTSFIKLPPPSTPIFLRIALALWSILLAIWRSLVGEIRAERTRRTRRRGRERASTAIRGLKMEVVSSDDGSASDGEGSPSEADGEGDGEIEGEGDGELGLEGVGVGPWIDPVTRATIEESAVDEPDDFEAPVSTVPPRPDTFTFRLRSASKRDNVTLSGSYDPVSSPSTSQLEHKPFIRQPTPPGILSNPIPRPPSPPTSSSSSSSSLSRSHTPRLLPNPLSTSLLDPSVPAVPTLRSSFALHPTSFAKPHQTPFHLQKTLILDLDETLIHSTSRPLGYSASAGGGLLGLSLGGLLGGRKSRREGHTVEVVLNGRSTTYHVYKRPYVDHFLKKVASWYTLVIYTASMPEYADPVIDWLDGGRGLFARKLYREACHLQSNGSYIKDLSLVEKDLSRVCFMDNSPVSYSWNKANALPIEGWTSDPNDEALLQSIPVLDSLRFVNDVRRILGIRGFH